MKDGDKLLVIRCNEDGEVWTAWTTAKRLRGDLESGEDGPLLTDRKDLRTFAASTSGMIVVRADALVSYEDLGLDKDFGEDLDDADEDDGEETDEEDEDEDEEEDEEDEDE